MWIDKWLFEKRTTVTEFAKQLGISRGYLSDIISRKYIPSRHIANKIQTLTKNHVKAVDIIFGKRKTRRKSS